MFEIMKLAQYYWLEVHILSWIIIGVTDNDVYGHWYQWLDNEHQSFHDVNNIMYDSITKPWMTNLVAINKQIWNPWEV